MFGIEAFELKVPLTTKFLDFLLDSMDLPQRVRRKPLNVYKGPVSRYFPGFGFGRVSGNTAKNNFRSIPPILHELQ